MKGGRDGGEVVVIVAVTDGRGSLVQDGAAGAVGLMGGGQRDTPRDGRAAMVVQGREKVRCLRCGGWGPGTDSALVQK